MVNTDVAGYALITGAASGIGRATAIAFANEGAAGLALLDRTNEGLQSAKDEAVKISSRVDFNVLTLEVDVTSETEVENAVARAVAQFGRTDYAINAAGILVQHDGGAAAVKTSDWNRVIEVNLNGTFIVLRAVARVMLRQDFAHSSINGRSLQRGSIVNVSSIAGLVGLPFSTAYNTSKHAVNGLTRNASEDHAKDGLRVNALSPGHIETPMTRGTPSIAAAFEREVKVSTPMGRPGTAEELTDAILFLAGGRSSFMTGAVLVVDGGYTQR